MPNGTLCWQCAKATGHCSWSSKAVPVPGWEAEPTKIRSDNGIGTKYVSSFCVRKCPNFVSDRKRKTLEAP